MPLTILVPSKELYDSAANEFYTTKDTTLTLEHSLLSVSKWESKWHKPYLSKKEKSLEEILDYIRCMTVNSNVDPKVYLALSEENVKDVIDYIENPMTATTIRHENQRPSREVITSELIYYWMTALNIPFDPCQKWHLARLLTLIEVASIKNQPPKKMTKGAITRRNSALNAQRRAKHRTSG